MHLESRDRMWVERATEAARIRPAAPVALLLHSQKVRHLRGEVARVTGLEPATFGVTGRRSNQLSYTRSGEAVPRATWRPCSGVVWASQARSRGRSGDCERL